MSDTDVNVNARVLVMQVIAGALMVGIFGFAGYLLLDGAWVKKPVGGMLCVELIPFAFVPSFITEKSVRESVKPEGRSLDGLELQLAVYQTRMIIRYALLEGAAFFALIAFMKEHHQWVLGVVGAVLVGMLLMFPTTTKVHHWIEAASLRRGFDDEGSRDDA